MVLVSSQKPCRDREKRRNSLTYLRLGLEHTISLWNLTAIQRLPGSFSNLPGSSPDLAGSSPDLPRSFPCVHQAIPSEIFFANARSNCKASCSESRVPEKSPKSVILRTFRPFRDFSETLGGRPGKTFWIATPTTLYRAPNQEIRNLCHF